MKMGNLEGDGDYNLDDGILRNVPRLASTVKLAVHYNLI